MIAVIFEVWPHPENRADYFCEASRLRPLLEKIDGFISVERFESLSEPGKILSLSFFRDEEAVVQWRNSLKHRRAQKLGRNGYFNDYRLRISEVIRDYGMNDRKQAPTDSQHAQQGN